MRTCPCGRNIAVTSQREITQHGLLKITFFDHHLNTIQRIIYINFTVFLEVSPSSMLVWMILFSIWFLLEKPVQREEIALLILYKKLKFIHQRKMEVPGAKCLLGGGGGAGAKFVRKGKGNIFFCRNGI